MKIKTFNTGIWEKTINLRDFVTKNITPQEYLNMSIKIVYVSL